MKCRPALALAVLAAWPLAAGADVLVTRDGLQIETEGPWEVKGRIVLFTALGDDKLTSMRLTEFDLEASEKATAEAAKAAEAEANAEEPPPPTSPLTRAILEAYVKEEVDAEVKIGHDDVSGQQWQDARQAVAGALSRLSVLSAKYDFQNPDAIRRIRYHFLVIAYQLRQVLLKPMPRRQEVLEGRRAVERLAALLEQVGRVAEDNPHLAIRLLNEAGIR